METLSRSLVWPTLALFVLVLGCNPSSPDAGSQSSNPGQGTDTALRVQAAAPVVTKTSAEIETLKVKAESGDASAQHQIGKAYFKGTGVTVNDTLAHEWCLKAAQQDHAEAQVYLGYMYVSGRGVPQDFTEAIRWYTKAAQQNNPSAQFNLGVMYDTGQGVASNLEEALRWFTKSAEQNFSQAQYNLGSMYETGRGVPQDYVQAITWYRKAAANGELTGTSSAELLETKMTPEQIAQAAKPGL